MAGISGISNLYSQFSTYRLLSSLSPQQIQRIGAINRTGSHSTQSTSKQGSYRQYYSVQSMQDSFRFTQDYQNRMAEMMTAAQSLLKEGGNASSTPMKVTSSDPAVAAAEASWRLSEAADYTVDVRQVAAAQVNRSEGIDSAGRDLSGELELQTAEGTFRFRASEDAADNREVLSRLAEEINQSDAGVIAKAETQKDGKVSFSLTAKDTGTNSQFAVSGDLASKLSGLEDAAVQAQNAVYTVQKSGSKLPVKERTSQSNSVYVDSNFRVKAELKSEGTAQIKVGADSGKTADSIQNLVNSFNRTLKLLNDNADRGEGVLKQMRRMVTPPTSEKSMALAGVSINKDGTLSFNRDVYTKAAQENPSLVREIVSGSYGLANGVYNDARQGMSVSSRSLLSEDLKEAQLASIYNPANIMGTYNRNGVYNMSNFYAVNVLMNLMV